MNRKQHQGKNNKFSESSSRKPANSPDRSEPTSTHLPFQSEYALHPRKVLDLFLESFRFILASDDLQQMIQSVKSDLYNRDYLLAFDSDDKRFAYVARWSPARALAYASLFSSIKPFETASSGPKQEKPCIVDWWGCLLRIGCFGFLVCLS